jgi:hypothetical protein
MSWRLGIVLALVLALLAALPAYAIPPGGNDANTAVDLNGWQMTPSTFVYDTKSGALDAMQEAWFKIYDNGTGDPIGVTLNYGPQTQPGPFSNPQPDPAVMFAVYTMVNNGGVSKMQEVGASTVSSQPDGVKYWRGSTSVPRTYYFQMRNWGPGGVVYAIANTGPQYPPPALPLDWTGGSKPAKP